MSEACVSFTELAFSTWHYNFNLFHQILFICYIVELFTDGLIESLCNARSLCVQRWNKIYRDRISFIIHCPYAYLNCGNLQFATETFKSVFC